MRILLYSDWPLASDYLDPIEATIRKERPYWIVERAGYNQPVPGSGYDWVVSCDELSVAPKGRRNLCVFHGMASKGQAFSTARKSAFVDSDTIFAVPGPRYATVLAGMGVPWERVRIVGLTKLDGVERNILFAPTHNPKLSAIPVVQGRIYELPNVRVRLHMWTTIGKHQHHQDLRSYYPTCSSNSSLEDLLWADTVIGDFGSIIVEAIALGKQAIQVVNPLWEQHYLELGLTTDEIRALPEVLYPARYAVQCHTFDDLYDALNIMPLGDPAMRVLRIMET
jgi:hypothetical protein